MCDLNKEKIENTLVNVIILLTELPGVNNTWDQAER